ncbi:unnamed protein product [Amoebophrya sp. A120]|nr:unnamed protein product [Amoebophrya sp. A120]|eukprot:GSA120T00004940001.1
MDCMALDVSACLMQRYEFVDLNLSIAQHIYADVEKHRDRWLFFSRTLGCGVDWPPEVKDTVLWACSNRDRFLKFLSSCIHPALLDIRCEMLRQKRLKSEGRRAARRSARIRSARRYSSPLHRFADASLTPRVDLSTTPAAEVKPNRPRSASTAQTEEGFQHTHPVPGVFFFLPPEKAAPAPAKSGARTGTKAAATSPKGKTSPKPKAAVSSPTASAAHPSGRGGNSPPLLIGEMFGEGTAASPPMSVASSRSQVSQLTGKRSYSREVGGGAASYPALRTLPPGVNSEGEAIFPSGIERSVAGKAVLNAIGLSSETPPVVAGGGNAVPAAAAEAKTTTDPEAAKPKAAKPGKKSGPAFASDSRPSREERRLGRLAAEQAEKEKQVLNRPPSKEIASRSPASPVATSLSPKSGDSDDAHVPQNIEKRIITRQATALMALEKVEEPVVEPPPPPPPPPPPVSTAWDKQKWIQTQFLRSNLFDRDRDQPNLTALRKEDRWKMVDTLPLPINVRVPGAGDVPEDSRASSLEVNPRGMSTEEAESDSSARAGGGLERLSGSSIQRTGTPPRQSKIAHHLGVDEFHPDVLDMEREDLIKYMRHMQQHSAQPGKTADTFSRKMRALISNLNVNDKDRRADLPSLEELLAAQKNQSVTSSSANKARAVSVPRTINSPRTNFPAPTALKLAPPPPLAVPALADPPAMFRNFSPPRRRVEVERSVSPAKTDQQARTPILEQRELPRVSLPAQQFDLRSGHAGVPKTSLFGFAAGARGTPPSAKKNIFDFPSAPRAPSSALAVQSYTANSGSSGSGAKEAQRQYLQLAGRNTADILGTTEDDNNCNVDHSPDHEAKRREVPNALENRSGSRMLFFPEPSPTFGSRAAALVRELLGQELYGEADVSAELLEFAEEVAGWSPKKVEAVMQTGDELHSATIATDTSAARERKHNEHQAPPCLTPRSTVLPTLSQPHEQGDIKPMLDKKLLGQDACLEMMRLMGAPSATLREASYRAKWEEEMNQVCAPEQSGHDGDDARNQYIQADTEDDSVLGKRNENSQRSGSFSEEREINGVESEYQQTLVGNTALYPVPEQDDSSEDCSSDDDDDEEEKTIEASQRIGDSSSAAAVEPLQSFLCSSSSREALDQQAERNNAHENGTSGSTTRRRAMKHSRRGAVVPSSSNNRNLFTSLLKGPASRWFGGSSSASPAKSYNSSGGDDSVRTASPLVEGQHCIPWLRPKKKNDADLRGLPLLYYGEPEDDSSEEESSIPDEKQPLGQAKPPPMKYYAEQYESSSEYALTSGLSATESAAASDRAGGNNSEPPVVFSNEILARRYAAEGEQTNAEPTIESGGGPPVFAPTTAVTSTNKSPIQYSNALVRPASSPKPTSMARRIGSTSSPPRTQSPDGISQRTQNVAEILTALNRLKCGVLNIQPIRNAPTLTRRFEETPVGPLAVPQLKAEKVPLPTPNTNALGALRARKTHNLFTHLHDTNSVNNAGHHQQQEQSTTRNSKVSEVYAEFASDAESEHKSFKAALAEDHHSKSRDTHRGSTQSLAAFYEKWMSKESRDSNAAAERERMAVLKQKAESARLAALAPRGPPSRGPLSAAGSSHHTSTRQQPAEPREHTPMRGGYVARGPVRIPEGEVPHLEPSVRPAAPAMADHYTPRVEQEEDEEEETSPVAAPKTTDFAAEAQAYAEAFGNNIKQARANLAVGQNIITGVQLSPMKNLAAIIAEEEESERKERIRRAEMKKHNQEEIRAASVGGFSLRQPDGDRDTSVEKNLIERPNYFTPDLETSFAEQNTLFQNAFKKAFSIVAKGGKQYVRKPGTSRYLFGAEEPKPASPPESPPAKAKDRVFRDRRRLENTEEHKMLQARLRGEYVPPQERSYLVRGSDQTESLLFVPSLRTGGASVVGGSPAKAAPPSSPSSPEDGGGGLASPTPYQFAPWLQKLLDKRITPMGTAKEEKKDDVDRRAYVTVIDDTAQPSTTPEPIRSSAAQAAQLQEPESPTLPQSAMPVAVPPPAEPVVIVNNADDDGTIPIVVDTMPVSAPDGPVVKKKAATKKKASTSTKKAASDLQSTSPAVAAKKAGASSKAASAKSPVAAAKKAGTPKVAGKSPPPAVKGKAKAKVRIEGEHSAAPPPELRVLEVGDGVVLVEDANPASDVQTSQAENM